MWVWYVAWFCWLAAAATAIVALVGSVTTRRFRGAFLSAAFVASALSVFPMAFSYHVYTIDFVAYTYDGTVASGPLWRVLAGPVAPLLVAVFAACVALVKQRGSVKA